MHRLLSALPVRIGLAAGFFTAIAVGLAGAGADGPRAIAAEGCAAAYHGVSWHAPLARDAGGAHAFEHMAENAAGQRIVYVGELHQRPEHIANLLELVCRLREREKAVAIGVEFLQQPFQPYVDDYLAGRIDESALRRLSDYDRRWGYDFEVYAPVLRYARAHGLALLALNVPSELSRKVARHGLASLDVAERAVLPAGLENAPRNYGGHADAAYLDNAHQGMSRERFTDALLLWDEGMAARAGHYVETNPDTTLVVLAGNGHIAWPGGIPERVTRMTGLSGPMVINHEGVAPPLPPGSYVLRSGRSGRLGRSG